MNKSPDNLRAAARQGLLAPIGGFHRRVQKLAVDFGTGQPLLFNKMPQGLMDLGMKNIRQFAGTAATGGRLHPGFHGIQQRALLGKPDGLMGPQSTIVKLNEFAQGVKAPAMGVAGEWIERLELAEYGE